MRSLQPGPQMQDAIEAYRAVDRRTPDGRCWLLANMVAGLDGSTAISGRVGSLSSPTDAALFRSLRSVADVVLVGAETVRRERYGPVKLPDDLRSEREASERTSVPALVIVSRSLEFDWSSPVFTDADERSPTMIMTCSAADPDRLAQARRHAPVLIVGADRVEPVAALDALAADGARVVLCEGGPTLLGELVAAGLVDELCLTIEPLMGGDPLPVAISPAAHDLVRFHLAHVLSDDSTLFLRYQRDGDPGRATG